MSSTLSDELVVEKTEKEEFMKYLQETWAEIDEKEAEIKKIEAIQLAELQKKTLTDEQQGIKSLVESKKGGLDIFLQKLYNELEELKLKKKAYFGLLLKVYPFSFSFAFNKYCKNENECWQHT